MRGLPRADLGALALLAALPLLLLWPLVLLGRVLYFRDLTQTSFPEMAFFARSLAEGQLPIWNPLLAGGYPQLASLSPPFFFPGLAPFFFLPFASAVTILVYANHALAGWSMYALGRYWRWSRPAGLLAAVAYAYSGYMVTTSNMYLLQSVAASLPLVILALERLCARPSGRHLALLTAVYGMHLAANRPDQVLLELILAGCLLTARAWQRRGSGPAVALRPAWLVALALGWALLLNGASLVPMLEFLPNSDREAGIPLAEAQLFSFAPAQLPALLVPDFFGDAERGRDWGRFFVGEPRSRYTLLFLSLYGGWASCLLLPIAWRSRRRDTRWLAVLLLAALLLAMGSHTPLYALFYRFVPLANLVRYPVKCFLLVNWCLAVLAGHSLDELLRRPWQYRRYLLSLAVVGSAAPLAWLVAYGGARAWVPWLQRLDYRPWLQGGPEVDINAFMRVSWPLAYPDLLLALAVAGGMGFLTWVGLVVASSREPRVARTRAVPLVAAAVVDLIGQNGHFNFTAHPDYYQRTPLVVEAIRRDASGAGPYRFHNPSGSWSLQGKRRDVAGWEGSFSLDETLMVQVMAAGRQQLIAYTPMAFDIAGVYPSYSLMPRHAIPPVLALTQNAPIKDMPARYSALAALFNVRYLVLPFVPTARHDPPRFVAASLIWEDPRNGVWLYRNERAARRAFFVYRAEEARDDTAALERLQAPDFDGRAEVVLAAPVTLTQGPAVGKPPPVDLQEHRNIYARAVVAAAAPGYLVLTDNYYPGWRAYLDGQEVPILRADLVARAVAVPAGRHVVEFRYLPLSAIAGAAASLLAWAVLLLWWRRRPLVAESAASVTIRS